MKVITVNRHNYEEFFLLYVDGELSAAEKQAVEKFVQENPDLAAELEMFKQTLLTLTDPVQFAEKSTLYKTQPGIVTPANYEEWILSYIDDELTDAEKEAVETFILENPALLNEFALLIQTRLEAEPVVFTGKESLYRSAKKERPIIYLRWWQIAAAVIGLGVMVWLLLPGNDAANRDFAASKPLIVQPAKNTAAKEKTAATAENNNAEHDQPFVKKQGSVKTIKPIIPVTVNSNEPVLAIRKQDVSPAETIRTATPVTVSPEINTAIHATGASIENNTLAVNDHSTDKNITQQTVYKELDTEDESKSLYLGSMEINKDKLRGLFRKATSIFKSKAAREEEGSAPNLK